MWVALLTLAALLLAGFAAGGSSGLVTVAAVLLGGVVLTVANGWFRRRPSRIGILQFGTRYQVSWTLCVGAGK